MVLVHPSIVFFSLISVHLLVFNVDSVTTSSKYKCAPAQHCDPRSQLCRSSEYIQAMIRGEPTPKETFETSRGICTDAYKWKCNKTGTRCKSIPYTDNEIKHRCKDILYTDQNDRDRFPDASFVEACQAGKYTCKSGLCSDTPNGCGGPDQVRYDKARCPRDTCGADDIITNSCSFSDKTWIVDDNKECIGEASITRPACCAKSPAKECEYIFFKKDSDTIPPETCGTVCIPPKCNGNGDGTIGSGETVAPTATPATGKPTVKVTGKTLTPTAKPTTKDVTLYGVTGFELTFNFGAIQNDCCCRLSCDCFGDPHCTNFFGHQVTSKISDGSFRMYEMVDFLFRVQLGYPQGIIKLAEVTVHGSTTKFGLSTEDCQNVTQNWKNIETGEFLTPNQIPSNWNTHYTFGNIYSDPNTFYVRDQVAQVAVEIKCVAFFIEENGVNVQETRLDIHVTKWNDLVGACCPTTAQNNKWFKDHDAAGFCVGNEKIPGSFDTNNPKGKRMLQALDSGVSDDSTSNVVTDNNNSNTSEDGALDDGTGTFIYSSPDAVNDNSTIDSPIAQELCEKYLSFIAQSKGAFIPIPALSTMEACIQNVMDFGAEALQRLIDALKNSEPACISDPNSPELLKPLAECEQGVVLEARPPGQIDWFPVRYLSSGNKYCSNTLVFDFSRTGYGIDSSYDFRLKRCQPDINRCGSCDAITKVTDVKLKWLYECASYNALKEQAKEELIEAIKNGDISCGFIYSGNSDPLACLKDGFPSLFGADDKPTQKPTTLNPTKKPLTVSPSKKPVMKAPSGDNKGTPPLPTKKPISTVPTKKPIATELTRKPTTRAPTKKPVPGKPTNKPTTTSPTSKPITKTPTKRSL